MTPERTPSQHEGRRVAVADAHQRREPERRVVGEQTVFARRQSAASGRTLQLATTRAPPRSGPQGANSKQPLA